MSQYETLAYRPLKLQSNRVWRTYAGGKMLETWQGKQDAQDSDFPEEWIASVVKAKNVGREQVEEGCSRVELENGVVAALKDIFESDPALFLGEAHARHYGASTAVLVKALDSAERLTIQVHPDPDFARTHFNSQFGKTEAWYVLGGRSLDGIPPQLYFGFKPGMTKEKWRRLFEAQDIPGMLDSLHAIPLQEGDVYLVEGGVPHAIGSGCFLIEIQEPTDLTLRTERTTPRGNPVPDTACHQGIGFDSMLDCFHYDAYSREETLQKWKIDPVVLRDGEEGRELQLIGSGHTRCFRMHRLDIHTALTTAKGTGCCIAVIVSGEGVVKWDNGSAAFRRADTFFLPASCSRLEWKSTGESDLQIVLCYPPETDEAAGTSK